MGRMVEIEGISYQIIDGKEIYRTQGAGSFGIFYVASQRILWGFDRYNDRTKWVGGISKQNRIDKDNTEKYNKNR